MARHRTGLAWRRRVENLGQWDWQMSNPATLRLNWPSQTGRLPSHLHVLLGSALCQFMPVQLPQGLRNQAEQLAFVRAQMQQQSGINGAQWVLTFDHPSATNLTIACAVPHAILLRLQTLAKEHGVKLVSLKPLVSAIWNTVAPSSQKPMALAAVEDDAFTVLVAPHGQLLAINAMPHRAESDLMAREIQRISFTHGPIMAQHLRLAISEKCRHLAHGHQDRLLLKRDYLRQPCDTTFQDLFLVNKVELA